MAHQVRDRALELYRSRLSGLLDAPDVVQLEAGVYEWALRFADSRGFAKSWECPHFAKAYATQAVAVLDNVDPGTYVGNGDLAKRIADRSVAAFEVASMTPQAMHPERWQSILDAKLEQEKYVYHERPVSMTDQFKCKRCKKREVTYQEMQLRSCDEPASLLITCLNCGYNWRVG